MRNIDYLFLQLIHEFTFSERISLQKLSCLILASAVETKLT